MQSILPRAVREPRVFTLWSHIFMSRQWEPLFALMKIFLVTSIQNYKKIKDGV